MQNENVPLYFQFYMQIRNEILLGERNPGERLPTIEELHREYGISTVSIRSALKLLKQNNYITAKQRLGIHISRNIERHIYHPPNDFNIESTEWKFWKSRLISAEWMTPPFRIVKLFKPNKFAMKNGLIYRIMRVWTIKKEAWRRRLCHTYVPAPLYEKLSAVGDLNLSIFELLSKIEFYQNQKITCEEIIHPWICDDESAKYLKIAAGEPVFLIMWKFYNENAELLWISEDLTTASTIINKFEVKGHMRANQ